MSSPQSLASPRISPVDFVSRDVDALAAHMHHCARAQSRWFAIGSRLQWAGSAAAGRLVTLACVAAVLAIGIVVLA